MKRNASGGLVNTEHYIPQRFKERILAHVYLAGMREPEAPLILGIQGPPGDGKSYQCRFVARSSNFVLNSISASELANELEGKPVERLREIYVKASIDIARRDTPGLLLIDDFDLGIAGIHKDVTYTVNTQLLTSFLMSLCDDPLLSNALTRSVPIILTGNNFSCLHGPLCRHGRMDLFEWIPTPDEKAKIVSSIFAGSNNEEMITLLLDKFKDMPISFFSRVVSALKVNLALRIIQNSAITITLSMFEASFRSAHLLGEQGDYDSDLFGIAEKLALENHTHSYIDRETISK